MAKRARSPAEAIAAALDALRLGGAAVERLLVAFSGGLDSTVLLAASREAAAKSGLPLSAVHFDHGWSTASSRWAGECAATAEALGVACEIERLPPPGQGESMEAWGRELRYAALGARATAGTVVMTAHHADDLAETFLLMALRGSGPRGLAAIAPSRPLGEGLLLRPLLGLGREELLAHARRLALPVMEDPSNADDRYDRNYLRHHVMPALFERWPGARKTLRRNAQLQHEAATVLEQSARLALRGLGASRSRLPLAGFGALSPPLQHLVLRCWLDEAGLPIPAAAQIERICAEFPSAAPDRNPRLGWPGGGIRRYDDALWIDQATVPWPAGSSWRWAAPAPLDLPGGRLSVNLVPGLGLSPSRLSGKVLEVRGRRGGERLRLPGHRHHKTLKHLLQEARVPPWQRFGLPLVYAGELLVAVPLVGVAEDFAATPDETGWCLDWGPVSG